VRCANCGSEVAEGKKFCANCGSAVAGPTPPHAQAPVPPVPPPPQATGAPPVVPGGAPERAPRKKGRSTAWTALAIVLGLLVLAGVIVGMVFVVKAVFPDKPVAKIEQLALKRVDGKSLDLDEVPLGVDISIEVRFHAKYSKDGRGTIKLYIVDGSGDEVMGDTFEVKSSGELQAKHYPFSMSSGSGKPLKVKAELRVKQGEDRISSDKSLTYKAEKGSVDEGGEETDTE
jgi:hypothetical protein